jgi:hypothetical protein
MTLLNSMVISKRLLLRWTFGVAFLIASSFLFAFVIDHHTELHFGKDGGLLFLAKTRIICSSLFFLIIKEKKRRFPGIGVLVGFLMYLAYVVFGGEIVYNSALVDQLIVSGLIAICGVIYSGLLDKKKVEVSS